MDSDRTARASEPTIEPLRTAEEMFSGPGEVRAHCRALDWEATSLGRVDGWPHSLRSAIALMLATPQPVYLAWGPDACSLYNDGYVPILGAKHPRSLGQPYREVWPEIWDRYRPIVEAAMRGETHHFVDELVPPGERAGTPRSWFTFSWAPVRDDGGQVAGFYSVAAETTEAVLAREALHAREDRYRALVAATGDVLYRMSPDWAEMHQLDGRGFLADTPVATGAASMDWLARYIHPQDQPRVTAAIEEAVRTRAVFDLEHRVFRADGTLGWTHSRAVPVTGADGAIAEWIGVASDVTAHRAAEAARERLLAESEAARDRTERLQRLTAALAAASTPDEVTDAVVRHTTSALAAVGTVVTRISADGEWLEILGASDMPDKEHEAWRRFPLSAPAPLAEAARSGEPVYLGSRAEWEARYPEILPELDAAGHQANAVVPLVLEGRVLGVIGAAYDVAREFTPEDRALALAVGQQCAQAFERARLFEAERDARREAEVASAAAQSANRAKSEFLAVMSHELRTPLNAIGGYAELIELGVHGPVTEAQRTALARIQVSQRHLLGLISGVLDYSRVEAGAVRYRLSDVPVGAAVAEAQMLVAPQVRAKGLEFGWSGAPPELSVRADREKLHQVLLNLLGNAVKFTTHRQGVTGRIDMSYTVSEAADGGAGGGGQRLVHLHVRDTGFGIAAEQLERIFEPFVQVDQRLTRVQEGVGLGLAISRDLARGMGGDLTAASKLGVGSVFTLTLPVAG